MAAMAMAMAMAADILSGKTSFSSIGRFSFSGNKSDHFPTNQTHPLRPISSGFDFDSDSSFDFNFCINLEEHRTSSADELFFDGKLLPVDMIKPPPLSSPPEAPRHPLPQTVSTVSDHPSSNAQNSTNNWRFRRSFSLTCFSGDNHKTLVSFQSSVQRLFRSKSTGCAPKVKEPPLSKDRAQDPKLRLQKRTGRRSTESLPLMGFQKPPLKKRYTGSYSPVLHIPSFDLFGLSSVFVRSREKISNRN